MGSPERRLCNPYGGKRASSQRECKFTSFLDISRDQVGHECSVEKLDKCAGNPAHPCRTDINGEDSPSCHEVVVAGHGHEDLMKRRYELHANDHMFSPTAQNLSWRTISDGI